MSENYSSGNVPQPTNPNRVLLVKILNATNSGGGGGGSGAPDFINYAGPPVTNPPALQNIVVDVNGQQWQFFGGSWH